MKYARPITLALIGTLLIATSPALAKSNKHGASYGKHGYGHEKRETMDDRGRGDGARIIRDSDRSRLLNYLEESRHCPPGLAKKRNGCLPPGQAKKYTRGMIVEPDIVWAPLPAHIVARLAPPPPGALYVQVDQNVLLVREATRKVLDAVTLFSAVK